MRTVAWLRAELAKFPDDATCYAYEGEVIGLIIEPPDPSNGEQLPTAQGVIYCSEDDDHDATHQTEYLPDHVVATQGDKACKTCRHWDTSAPYQPGKGLGLGECKAVVMLWDATRWSEDGESREIVSEHAGKKAFVQDGSDYTASLFTLADFACTQYEPITSPPASPNPPN